MSIIFKDADTPIAVPLEPGMAVIFQKDMDELINKVSGVRYQRS